MTTVTTDIAVVGGGLIGTAAALALRQSLKAKVEHLAPSAPADERTTALLADAIEMLERLGVWDLAHGHAAPLRTMQLIDGSRRLLRPRPLTFEASEIGRDAFGYNIRNVDLLAAMRELENVPARDTAIVAAERRAGLWHLTTADGDQLIAPIVLAADGRDSLIRRSAGIEVRRWSYPQIALVTTFAHERPHNGISVEFHTETGPFTQVPLVGTSGSAHRSSLVWVVKPEHEADMRARSDAELSAQIGEKLHFMFGEVKVERPLAGYPLAGLTAETFGKSGVMLLGEAAHLFPPIGAQGANLGFRDLADCLDILGRAAGTPDDTSGAYADKRSADVRLRTLAVDVLNRSLLTDMLPVQAARALGTSLLANVTPLKRAVMRAGLSPDAAARA